MFPEDSLQSLIHPDAWWEESAEGRICRGALIYAFTPYVDQTPYSFEPIARASATEHSEAIVKVAPLRVDQPLKQTELPVAAMPLHGNEVWAAYRAKRRPCLIFGANCATVDKSLTRGKANHSTAPTFLAAPFYGVERNSTRAGYSDVFVERVRHCEYPQFHWDKLPITGAEESILRLDHIQPFGAHHDSYKLTGHKLSDGAMALLDDMLSWLVWGGVPELSLLLLYREMIENSFKGSE